MPITPPDTNGEIITASGRYVNVFDPDPDTIFIEDIAHALANQCRFGGHTKRFYSVAEHCIVAIYNNRMLPVNILQWLLLHDASEAYLCDLPRPIKQHLCLSAYSDIEDRLMKVIAERFRLCQLTDNQRNLIHTIDMEMLATERRDLLVQDDRVWDCLNGVKPYNDKLLALGHPELVKYTFLTIWNNIRG